MLPRLILSPVKFNRHLIFLSSEYAVLNTFQKKVLESERNKLLAVQNKLPVAIHDRDLARVVGLAQAAERIAARLVILLNNVKG